MKKTVFIIVIVLFLKPILPVLEYTINYDYITKTLCVNKAKPQMHCNGKCHLMKELAKASESEKPISSDKKHLLQESEILFFEAIKTYESLGFIATHSIKGTTHYSDLYSYLKSSAVFHPPTFIS